MSQPTNRLIPSPGAETPDWRHGRRPASQERFSRRTARRLQTRMARSAPGEPRRLARTTSQVARFAAESPRRFSSRSAGTSPLIARRASSSGESLRSGIEAVEDCQQAPRRIPDAPDAPRTANGAALGRRWRVCSQSNLEHERYRSDRRWPLGDTAPRRDSRRASFQGSSPITASLQTASLRPCSRSGSSGPWCCCSSCKPRSPSGLTIGSSF